MALFGGAYVTFENQELTGRHGSLEGGLECTALKPRLAFNPVLSASLSTKLSRAVTS